MAGHHLHLLERPLEELRGAACAVGMAQPVEPEAANTPALIPPVGQCVEKGVWRQAGVEGRVEDRDLRNAGKQLSDGLDTIQRRAIVERREEAKASISALTAASIRIARV